MNGSPHRRAPAGVLADVSANCCTPPPELFKSHCVVSSPDVFATPQPAPGFVAALREIDLALMRSVDHAGLLHFHDAPIDVTDVAPYLFVGRFPSPQALTYLESRGITDIVNVCSGERRSSDVAPYGMGTLSIAASDEPDFLILYHHLDEFVDYVDRVRQRGGKVFAHCIAGVNRSVTLCVAYLMMKEKMKAREVIELFYEKGRFPILTNVGFRQQLAELQHNISRNREQQ